MVKKCFTTLLNKKYYTHASIYRFRLFFTLLAALSFLFLESATSSAQTAQSVVNDTIKETTRINFPIGSANILQNYSLNKFELSKIDTLLGRMASDSTLTLQRLIIVGYASPDGRYDLNEYLARLRTERLKNHISSIKGLAPERIVTSFVAEDWKGVASFAEQATTAQLPNRDKVIEVARSAIDPDEKERILRSTYPGDFRYLLVHCMPALRRTDWSLEYQVARPGDVLVVIDQSDLQTDTVAIDTVVAVDSIVLEQLTSLSDVDEVERTFYLMLKTNLLFDAVAIPNVGVELSLGRRWSIAGEWMYAWWKSDRRHRYWQGYGGYLGVRKYFGKTADGHPFTGHHIGAYGSTMTYDVEWGGRGYQASRFGFGGGVEYGYSTALARRLNLDFAIGLGFHGEEYKVYDPIDSHYVWHSTHKRNWWGPTKACISLVWLIGHGNVHKKKGGML